MKNIISILLVGLLLMPIGFAEEKLPVPVANGLMPNAGLIYYIFDVIPDDVRIAFTFDPTEKAKVKIEIARERIAEMEEMAKRKDKDAMETAKKEHNKQIKEVEELEVDDELEVEEELQKHILVLEGVILRIRTDNNTNNDNALVGLENALTQSSKVLVIVEEERIREEVKEEGIKEIKGEGVPESERVTSEKEIKEEALENVEDIRERIKERYSVSQVIGGRR